MLAACALIFGVGWPLTSRLTRDSAVNAMALPLRQVAVVALPGGATRFDYAAIDPAAHRLFLAHMDDNTLVEVDTATRQVIRTVGGLPELTGVIVVPSLHRVFASAAGVGQVVSLREGTGAVLARTSAGGFPDGLAYVATTGQVWVSDEDGGVETVIDASTGARVATVALGGQAGNVRYDPIAGRVLADVQTRDQVVVINPHTRAVTARVPVPGCQHDHGLVLDPTRAYVACDGNNVVVVLRLANLSRLGVHRVGDQPDVLALDPSRHLLYVAAESGVPTMIDMSVPGGQVTGRARLGGNAHVVAVDPSTGLAYFPLRSGPHGTPELLITTPGKEPIMATRPPGQLRAYVRKSPLLQIVLFLAGLIGFLLLAEYSGLFGV
ncbi:MAG: YncE family protein [Mycobacteriales bacterium]